MGRLQGEPARPSTKTCYFCGERDATRLSASLGGKYLRPVCDPCRDDAKSLNALEGLWDADGMCHRKG